MRRADRLGSAPRGTFESPEAAQQNSDKPAQDAWWQEFSGLLNGEATFHDTDDVVADMIGDPDSAELRDADTVEHYRQ